MTVTYEYRVKYNGKYYAPGEPVEVKETETPKPDNNAEATRRTQKR